MSAAIAVPQRLHVRLGLSDVHRTSRLVLGVVCFWLATLPTSHDWAWVWLGALLLIAWWAPWLNDPTPSAIPLLGEAVVIGLAVLATHSAGSPLLPYLLAPVFSLGVARGNRAVALGGLVLGLLIVGGNIAIDGAWTGEDQVLTAWVVLGCAGGLLGSWAHRLKEEAANPHRAHYDMARALLRQLQDLSGHLPGSLDPGAVANDLIEDCWRRVGLIRAAVLTRYETEELVPLALRGAERIPWADQLVAGSALWQAVRTNIPQQVQRDGVSLAFIPLMTGAKTTGVLVAERAEGPGWRDADLQALAAAAAEHELPLETALLFAELRHTATLEERDRLAREMHNGVAQDLASFGFELDSLRMRLKQTTPEMADDVAAMRGRLTGMVQDIRHSISDLRTTVGPERGLGAALSTHLQSIGSTSGVTVHLTLRESPMRLPAEQEMALFRAVQEFVTHARKHGDAKNVWVSLDAEPPGAVLELGHDGAPEPNHECGHLARLTEQSRMLAANVHHSARTGGGERMEIQLLKGKR